MPEPSTSRDHSVDKKRRTLLSTRLSDLKLDIIRSHLEAPVNRLYVELGRAGIDFKPGTYLSDGWGCPSNVPIVGIPFYLASRKIFQIVKDFIEPAPWDQTEILTYLRHECGHALNYAYLLHRDGEWENTFGLFSKPYQDNYRAVPFDARFVRHSHGWYAQKHPDEDFAETFAVWLAPDSGWREKYEGTPVLRKLQYVDQIARQLKDMPVIVTDGGLDRPLSELNMTLGAWCRARQRQGRKKIALPVIINEDLRRLFPDTRGRPAAEILRAKSRMVVHNTQNWTGINRDLLSSLVNELAKRAEALGLLIEPGKNPDCGVRMTAFITALAMNYQYTGKFVKDK